MRPMACTTVANCFPTGTFILHHFSLFTPSLLTYLVTPFKLQLENFHQNVVTVFLHLLRKSVFICQF